MAARRRKRRTSKRRATKTLTQRVTALENAIKPKRGKRTGSPRIVMVPANRGPMTPPHVMRQLGL